MTDSKSRSIDRYNRFAQGYVTSKTHASGSDLDRLVAIADPQPGWMTLDIATGGGHTALTFAPHVDTVIATDITPKMLDAAARHFAERDAHNIRVQLADAENLPFDDARFDLVTCRIAPHHFPDVPRFVGESVRVLKAGGLLLVQDHVLPDDGETAAAVDDFERFRDPSHNRAYSQPQWVAMFEAAGLTVTYTEQITKRHELLPWAVRQGNTPEMVAELYRRLQTATEAVAGWMQPDGLDDLHTASFVNHHLMIAGRK